MEGQFPSIHFLLKKNTLSFWWVGAGRVAVVFAKNERARNKVLHFKQVITSVTFPSEREEGLKIF